MTSLMGPVRSTTFRLSTCCRQRTRQFLFHNSSLLSATCTSVPTLIPCKRAYSSSRVLSFAYRKEREHSHLRKLQKKKDNPFKVLGLDYNPDDNDDEPIPYTVVKQAFLQIAMSHHPDTASADTKEYVGITVTNPCHKQISFTKKSLSLSLSLTHTHTPTSFFYSPKLAPTFVVVVVFTEKKTNIVKFLLPHARLLSKLPMDPTVSPCYGPTHNPTTTKIWMNGFAKKRVLTCPIWIWPP